MGDPDQLLSREEVLGGLPARRARAALFLIDQHTARHVASREVGPMSLLGERAAEARELASIEHFAMGREPLRRPTIREIELAAEDWGPLMPEGPSVRAAIAALLAERHDLDPARLPGTRAALGLDDKRVAAAYERQQDRPIDEIWSRLGPAERLRWAVSAPGRWLEQTTPLRAAAALTFLLSMGQTVVVIPIAVATVGPLAAAVSIAVIGLLALTATAAIAEAAARSGEVRFRGGFFGRLVIGGLGPLAGAVPAALGIIGVVLPTVSALIGLGLLLAILLPLPAALCTLVVGVLATAVPLRGSRSASFGGLLSFGLASIGLLALLSVLVLVLALAGDGLTVPALGPPEGIGIELALGVIIGVLLGSYADPVYTVQIGRMVLPRDPDGRGFVRGSMLGMAAFVVVTVAFSAVVILTVPAAELAGNAGSALDPLSSKFGAVVTVLAGMIGIGLFGIRLYGNAVALFDFVAERLPGRPPSRVVLAARRGRVLLSRRDGVSAPALVLAYRGPRAGHPVLAVSTVGEDGVETRERPLAETGDGVEEEGVGLRLVGADQDRLQLDVDTTMAISYDDQSGLVGRGVAETLLAEDGSGALAAWLLRAGGADSSEAAAHLGISPGEARGRLRALVEAGSARETEEGRFEPLLAARRPRGSGLGADLWSRLGSPETTPDPAAAQAAPEQASAASALTAPLARALLCSLPMIGLTVLCALLIAAGTGSVSGPLKIAGVICFATISGVLPPLLLLAARRRSDIAGAASGGTLVAIPLLVLMVVAALAALVLHATILWDDPFERALAALAAVTAVAAIALSFRNGSFRPATVLDLREEHAERGLRVRAERGGAIQNPRLRLGGEQLSSGARPELEGEAALDVEAPFEAGGELRISAQSIDPVGASAALPLEVELRGAEFSEVRRLDELGGATVFDLDGPAWTLVVRRCEDQGQEDDAAPPSASPPGDDAPGDPPAPGRRRRGGGPSPLDKL